MSRSVRSALLITAVTALLLTAFALSVLAAFGGDIFAFVNIGERFAQGIPNGRVGGEGQFPYYIATEGFAPSAIAKMDPPAAYRYQRILYPALVALLALGNAALVPYLMLAVNVIATSALTGLTAYVLITRTRVSGWLALLVGVWLGSMVCVRYNTTEPLALALGMGAVVAYLHDKFGWAAVLAACAGLTKEIGLVLVGGVILHALWQRRFAAAMLIGAVAVILFGAWALVLRTWLQAGIEATQANRQLSLVPFAGLFGSYSPVFLGLGLLWAVLPAVMLGVSALHYGWRNRAAAPSTLPAEVVMLLVAAGFVVLVPSGTFEDLPSTLRYSQPLIIAALLFTARCYPRRAGWLLVLWLPTVALGLGIAFAGR
jgi:hypothetical protein